MAAAKPIQKWQIKVIYALGGTMGLVEKDNRQDNLHLLVDALTGKDSVSALTSTEADRVIGELRHQDRFGSRPAPARPEHPEKPGGVSAGQQRKVWALMYELAKYDESPSTATMGERLVGIIKRELNIDATVKSPFAWLEFRDGNRLIETLKGYISSARRKSGARSGTG